MYPGQHLAVVGAVMQDIAVRVDLVELAREQASNGRGTNRTCGTGPSCLPRPRCVRAPRPSVLARLRTSRFRNRPRPAPSRFCTACICEMNDEATRAVTCSPRAGFEKLHLRRRRVRRLDRLAPSDRACPCRLIASGGRSAPRIVTAVEAHDEPVPEVVGHTAAVARGVAHDQCVCRA